MKDKFVALTDMNLEKAGTFGIHTIFFTVFDNISYFTTFPEQKEKPWAVYDIMELRVEHDFLMVNKAFVNFFLSFQCRILSPKRGSLATNLFVALTDFFFFFSNHL